MEHAERWAYHNAAAEAELKSVWRGVTADIPVKLGLAQVHAALAQTHAYLMVEGLR